MSSGREYFDIAAQHQKNGNDELAIEYYTKAIYYESNSNYYYQRGNLYFRLQKYNEAITDYSSAIERSYNSDDKSILFRHRADAYLELHDYSEAIKNFSVAYEVTNTPNTKATALVHRSFAYQRTTNLTEAIEDSTQAMQLCTLDRNDIYESGLTTRGDIYSFQKKYDLALSDYSKILNFFPETNLIYHRRGLIYAELKQHDEALNDLLQTWNNPKTKLSVKLHTGLQLKKIHGDDDKDEEKIPIRPLYNDLRLRHNNAEDLSILLLAANFYNDLSVMNQASQKLFKDFLPCEIPFYLIENLFQLLLNKKNWPLKPLAKNNVKDSKKIKDQLRELAFAIVNEPLKQNVLAQMLIGSTWFGSIAGIKRLIREPTISSSKNKQAIFAELEQSINAEGVLFDLPTSTAFFKDKALQKDLAKLKKKHPVLFITLANKDLLAELVSDSSLPMHSVFFKTPAIEQLHRSIDENKGYRYER